MDKPNEQAHNFPHVMRWPRLGRQGKRCEILRNAGNFAHIRFEDGMEAIIAREALRRYKPPQEPNPPEDAATGK